MEAKKTTFINLAHETKTPLTLINNYLTVGVHNEIVSYYANLLCKAESSIMNDFPIGVGCDEVMPGLMKDKDFKKEYKDLFNVSL